jgi:hypothetical protein
MKKGNDVFYCHAVIVDVKNQKSNIKNKKEACQPRFLNDNIIKITVRKVPATAEKKPIKKYCRLFA